MSGSATPSDSPNSGGFVFSDDVSYGFAHRDFGEMKCRTCPDISSVESAFNLQNQSVELTRNTWLWGIKDRSRTSGTRKSSRSLRRNRRSALLSRERRRNNSFCISNGKNGWLITANKGCQTTESTTSFAKGATISPVWNRSHREIGADYRQNDSIRSAESIRVSKRNEDGPRLNPTLERESDAKLISTVSNNETESCECNRNSIPKGRTGISMSDSILAIPKYDHRSVVIFRQRKQRQDSEFLRKQADLLKCREFTSNHRMLALGNEVHQIWTRKRNAKTAMQSVSASPDKKRRVKVGSNSVEWLWKTTIPCTITSGDENGIEIGIPEKSLQIPEIDQVGRLPVTTKIAESSQNLHRSVSAAADQMVNEKNSEDYDKEERFINDELPMFDRHLLRSESQNNAAEESLVIYPNLSRSEPDESPAEEPLIIHTNLSRSDTQESPSEEEPSIFYPNLSRSESQENPSEEPSILYPNLSRSESQENPAREPSISYPNLSRNESQESVQIVEVRKHSAGNQFPECPRRNHIVSRDRRNRDACSKIDINDVTIISMKKDRANVIVVTDHEELDSRASKSRHGRNARNLINPDNDDDDYHFLMSLYHQLRKMPEAKKLKMRLRMQTMFCDEIESESSSSRSRTFL